MKPKSEDEVNRLLCDKKLWVNSIESDEREHPLMITGRRKKTNEIVEVWDEVGNNQYKKRGGKNG